MKNIILFVLFVFSNFTIFSQEIEISQGGTPIAHGGSFDFGNVNVGSSSSVSFTITNPDPSINLTITTPITVMGIGFSCTVQPSNSVISSGGTTTFTIQFSPIGAGAFAGSVSIANNDANENPYDISISGTGVCTLTASITSQTNVACNGQATGSVTASGANSSGPYSYIWSNGNNTATCNSLPAGGYTCTVTDGVGCTVTTNATITQPATALSASTSKVDVLCNGNSTGSSTALPSGGTAAYTFLWSNGVTTASSTGLTAGTYTCTVTDANACTTTTSAAINQPASALGSSSSTAKVQCETTNSGAINLSPSGGTTPYSFAWSNGSTSEDLTGLAAGSYSCTITDANGCIDTESPIVSTEDCSKIGASWCGTTLSSLSEQMLCETVGSATNYRYEITDGTNTYNFTKGSATIGFRFTLVAGTSLGTEYTIKVAPEVGGIWSAYGEGCVVTTPPTYIRTSFNNTTLTALSDLISCETVLDATNYRYELFDGTTTINYEKGSASNLLRLSDIPGIKYGTEYTIKAASYKNGQWTAYGATSTITTPYTSLKAFQCGTTIPKMNKYLECYEVAGATNYKYELVPVGGGTTLNYERGAATNDFRLSWVPGVLTNKTYQIKVSAFVGGSWMAYGADCAITTPVLREGNFDNNEIMDNVETQDFEFLLYPNPNNGTFTISSSAGGIFQITNELGQLVQTIELTKNKPQDFVASQNIEMHLKPGVYFVRSSVNDEIVTTKIVVQ